MKKKLAYLFSATFFATTLSFFVTSNYAFSKEGSSVVDYRDGIAFPGSGCKPQKSGSKFVREQGMYFNTSSTTQIIYCSIPQYNKSDAHTPLIHVFIHLIDRNEDTNVVCHVKAKGFMGSHFDTDTVKTKGTGYFEIGISGLSGQEKKMGYSYIKCFLPPVDAKGASGIVQYNVGHIGHIF